jgi:hypothetical protein
VLESVLKAEYCVPQDIGSMMQPERVDSHGSK